MRYELTKDKFLTEHELAEVIHACNSKPGRDSTLIKFALATGARASEILAIKLSDLDTKLNSVYIRANKDGRNRDIYLDINLFNEVYSLAISSSNNMPFPFGYQRLVQIWAKYRIGGKKFHSLRHSAAMLIYKQTKDIKVVQTFLGHRRLSTTAIYTDFQYSVDEMSKIRVGSF